MICNPVDARLPQADAKFPADGDGQWFALHTNARQEKILAAELAARGIQCYLPVTAARRVYAGVEARVQAPLFPGQLFLKGTIDDVRVAERTGRVIACEAVPDGARLEHELRNLHRAVSAAGELEVCPLPGGGFEVEVRSGPLQGVRGMVDTLPDARRIVLPMNSMQSAVSADVTGWLLEPAM
jgi:hypothetical protein